MTLTLGSKLELKHKVALFGILALALAWAAFIFVFQPERRELAELQDRYKAERQRVEAIEAYGLAHPDAAVHLSELDTLRAATDRMLPESPGVSDFLVLVEAAARGSGVQLLQVRPAQAAAKDSYQATQVEVSVRGDFFQTVNFLKKLEDGPRFNAVTNLVTAAKPGGGLESKLQVVIYNKK